MSAVPNPVVRSLRLLEYPGWLVRQRACGRWDAERGPVLSPGFSSFRECLDWIISEEARA